MPANFLHGAEVIEIDGGLRPIRGVKTAVIGLVGTAPVLDVDAAYQAPNQITLITNDVQARAYFGEDRAGFTIPAALAAGFAQGNGPIFLVVNVLDKDDHKTAVTDEVVTVGTDNTIPLAHAQVSSVVLKSTDGNTTYTLTTEYTVNAPDGVLTRVPAGSIPAGATLHASYSYLDVTKVTSSDLIGTVDGSGFRTGMQLWLEGYQRFGFFPKILIAPGYSSTTTIDAALSVIAHKVRAIYIADAPAGTTPQAAIQGRGPAGAINFNTSSDRAYLAYPHIKRWNPDTEDEEVYPFSAFLAGVIAANDIENGYWWSPSNHEILGITGMERHITAMINDPASEANLLNEAGIVTVFNSFGSGFRVWGNRTAAWPSTTHPKNFLNIRRTADVIAESIEYSMLQFIDRPITQGLIDSITESVNSFGRTLIARGALIDFDCWFDPAKNPATEIALGHLTFSYAFMPPPPAERLTFESLIDITMLSRLSATTSA